jgi:DNA-binding winged helix-turn-helix (wHTH) protein/Tol biopolymer transport system component
VRFFVTDDRSSPVYARFDQFQVDLSRGQLLKAGVSVAIQEQPLQVLRLLIKADGQVVTREELCAVLWPKGTFVDFEHGVNTAVKKLRQALDDSAESPRFVQTLPRIGYRFMLPIEWATNSHNSNGHSTNGHYTNGHSLDGDRNGMPLAPDAVPVSPLEPTPHPISSAMRPSTPSPVVPTRLWKLKALIAMAVLVAVALTLRLSDENSNASRSQLGTFLRGMVFGGHAGTRTVLSQRRLTANPDGRPLTSGIISPDGKQLAYSDAAGLNLRQIDGGETFLVPLPPGFDALPQSWFPDGVHMVVARWEDAQKKPPSLWEISVMGGTPRKLADQGLSARVSPDGSKIVFLTGKWDDEEIWLIDTDKNTTQKIAAAGEDHFGPVAWAPDSKRFASVRRSDIFNNSDRHQSLVEVHELTNGRSTSVLSNPSLGKELVWLPGGRLIYSLQEVEPAQNDFNLWSAQLDSRTGRTLGTPTRITNDHNPIAGVSISTDGKRLALLRRLFQTDVYLTEFGAHGARLSTPRRFTLDDRGDLPSAWTPDSNAVLFFSDRDEGHGHIFKQRIDEAVPELLVGGKGFISPAKSTPDGLSFLFLAYPEPGDASDHVRIMRLALSGGASSVVLEGPKITGVNCTRLPSTLCVYSRFENGVQTFFPFHLGGEKGKEIVMARREIDDGPGSGWALSPNGRYLAFPKSPARYEVSRLRILDLTKETESDVTLPTMPLIMGINWAADSKTLWVGGWMGRSARGNRSGLLSVDLHGRVTTMLEGSSSMAIWSAVPSPDGHRLALQALGDDANVSLLENF